MLYNYAVLALSALTPMVAAQVPDLPYTLSYTPDLSIGKVPLARRSEWCRGETNVCDKLCGAPSSIPTTNNCDTNTLAYSCICKNGTAPGLQYYQNSLPSFICEEAFAQCEAARAGNATGQEDCKTGVRSLCGTLDANKATTGGSSTSTTTSSSASGASATASGTAASTTQPGAAHTSLPQMAGLAAAAVVMGAFAL